MKRLTYEFVKEQFEKEGYELLSKEYVNSRQKLKYRCPEGHVHSITFSHWKTGNRCPICSKRKSGIKKRLGINYIKELFKLGGYILLTTEYKNAKQKLDYICPNGHKHKVIWNKFQQGVRCPYCSKYSRRYTIDEIKASFEKGGYVLLSVNYKRAKSKLNCVCPEGHNYTVSWEEWKYLGSRCPICAGNARLTIEFVRSEFKKEDYRLLTTRYVNNTQKLNYICPEGHKHSISWNKWYQGRRCPICAIINRSGDRHYGWLGGISCEPYCDVWLDKEFKESIKERDNYTCQNLDCWCKDGKAGELTIHHIDYVKKNCSPNNLITLCRSCNSRANKNREYWQKFYERIIERKLYRYKEVFNYGS